MGRGCWGVELVQGLWWWDGWEKRGVVVGKEGVRQVPVFVVGAQVQGGFEMVQSLWRVKCCVDNPMPTEKVACSPSPSPPFPNYP